MILPCILNAKTQTCNVGESSRSKSSDYELVDTGKNRPLHEALLPGGVPTH